MKRLLFLVLSGLAIAGAVYSRKSAGRPTPPAGPMENTVEAEIVVPLPEPPTPTPPRRRRGALIDGEAFYRYVGLVPPDDGVPGQKWPLIVFLHGACGDENREKLKHFGPIKYGLDHDEFGFIAVAPASARGWSINGLNTFLNQLTRQMPAIDSNRVYLTGYSMGAQATWAMAAAFPHRFAAIAPVAGSANPNYVVPRMRQVPVWVFHGARDTVIPAAYGRIMIQALEKAGAEVKSTIYPNCGHEVWDVAYREDALYQWFLDHPKNHSPSAF